MYNLLNGIGAVNEHDEISINITPEAFSPLRRLTRAEGARQGSIPSLLRSVRQWVYSLIKPRH